MLPANSGEALVDLFNRAVSRRPNNDCPVVERCGDRYTVAHAVEI
jgi:hypothetical protein